MYYQKKPVVIEALQWDGTDQSFEKIKSVFSDIEVCGIERSQGVHGKVESWMIRTLEGQHIVSEGDYVIRGIKGEYYPCKPEIFEASYEESKEYGRITPREADVLLPLVTSFLSTGGRQVPQEEWFRVAGARLAYEGKLDRFISIEEIGNKEDTPSTTVLDPIMIYEFSLTARKFVNIPNDKQAEILHALANMELGVVAPVDMNEVNRLLEEEDNEA